MLSMLKARKSPQNNPVNLALKQEQCGMAKQSKAKSVLCMCVLFVTSSHNAAYAPSLQVSARGEPMKVVPCFPCRLFIIPDAERLTRRLVETNMRPCLCFPLQLLPRLLQEPPLPLSPGMETYGSAWLLSLSMLRFSGEAARPTGGK